MARRKTSAAAARPLAGYYRHPTLHGDTVVFVSEDDLWAVASEGGVARRLTASPGRISLPAFSPDGKLIAFTGSDDGPTEVYVMDAAGGEPRRLSHLGSGTGVVTWRLDGKAVICFSDWQQPFPRRWYAHLHAIPLQGGAPRPLNHGPARAIAWQPRGKGVVLGRNSDDPALWKRYRGGTAGTLWIDPQGKGVFKPLLKLAGNLAAPMWIGARIYFLSDHEGHGNLYSCTASGRGLKRHTHHEDFYARFPSSDGKRIVYHAGADLWLYDPKTDRTRRIEIAIRSSRTENRRRFVYASNSIERFRLHPKGHSIAAVARGGAFSMALWEGAHTRYGVPSRDRYRLLSWLPDGKHMVAVSDAGGEEALVVIPVEPGGRMRTVRGDVGRPLELEPAPANGKRVALTNHRQELLLVDLRTGRRKLIDKSEFDRIQGIGWSADGRYLAYGMPVSRKNCCIRVYDTRLRRKHDVTRPDFRDVQPAFDPGGKYLYFISYRVFDPVYDNQCFDLGFPRGSRPYLVTLRKDTPAPFALVHRPPRAPEAPKKDEEKRGWKVPPKVTIDFAGIESRVITFPVPEGVYERILGGRGRAFYSFRPIEGSLDQQWLESGEPPAKCDLECYDLDKERTETIYEGMSDFSVSQDAKTLAVRTGNQLRVLPVGTKWEDVSDKESSSRESGWVEVDRMRIEVSPRDEWRQMFREAWRLQRDQFWTPDMSGVDWASVHDRYLPLLDRVGTRAEFSDLIWEMQGELGTSHCYEMGGDYRPVPEWFQGFLGADLEYDRRTGTWKIARIPRGDSWDRANFSPLNAPSLNVREGDEILAVAGRKVGADCSPYECLVHRAQRAMTLTLRSRGKRRTISVRTLDEEHGLRYRDWVERNREYVHKKSKGRAGYVHVPDMGPFGYAMFHRYYVTEVDRPGLVIDVRFNGGGHVSQLLLEKLMRRRIGYDAPRHMARYPYPDDAPVGPMVALTNEYAGSDGDIFSHSFKAYQLGPLIGKRTWGGVIGIWPRHALVDGTYTSQPEFGYWTTDAGWGLENYGTDPDIEVEIYPQDYRAGRDPQLDRGLEELEKIIRKHKPALPALEDKPNLAPPKLPPATPARKKTPKKKRRRRR